MLRISLLQAFNQGVRGILNSQKQTYDTLNQISTGRRVLQPSDDPLAAARILQLEQDQSRIAQYQKNIDGVESNLALEESQLEAVGNILLRVREIGVQAGNGTLGQQERIALAEELDTRLDELLDLANTRNASGEYIFGGFQGEQEPFIEVGGRYHYRGDEGQRFVQIATNTQIASGDSGKAIFVAVPSPRLPASADAGNTGNATISSGQVVDKAAYDANFSGSYTINFTAADTYEVVPLGGGPAVATGTYTSGEPITFNGVELRIVGTPATGDSFQVDPPATQNILDTVAKLADNLRTLGDNPDDQLRLQDVISESLDNLDSAEGNISAVRARIGARMNTLDSTRELHDGVNLVNEKVLSDVRDLDYAEAISRLTMENFVLQAAQQSFAKISNLSLFNFLR